MFVEQLNQRQHTELNDKKLLNQGAHKCYWTLERPSLYSNQIHGHKHFAVHSISDRINSHHLTIFDSFVHKTLETLQLILITIDIFNSNFWQRILTTAHEMTYQKWFNNRQTIMEWHGMAW